MMPGSVHCDFNANRCMVMVMTKISQSKNLVNFVGFGKGTSSSNSDSAVKNGKQLKNHVSSTKVKMPWTKRDCKISHKGPVTHLPEKKIMEDPGQVFGSTGNLGLVSTAVRSGSGVYFDSDRMPFYSSLFVLCSVESLRYGAVCSALVATF